MLEEDKVAILQAQERQVQMLKSRPEEMLRFVLDEKTGAEPFVLPFWMQSMCGTQPPPIVDRDGLLVMPVTFQRAGWGRMDLKQQRLTDILFTMGQVSEDGYKAAAGGSADENMNISAAGPLVFAVHWQEYNAQYTGFYNLDTRKWSPLGRGVPYWDGKVGHNAQCGNNAASIAYGAVYHQAFHVVHNWVPRKGK